MTYNNTLALIAMTAYGTTQAAACGAAEDGEAASSKRVRQEEGHVESAEAIAQAVDVKSFIWQRWELECQRYRNCGLMDSFTALYGPDTDCVEMRTARTLGNLEPFAYDRDLGAQCMEAIEAKGCAVWSSEALIACGTALSGTLPYGVACEEHAHCAGRGYCDRSHICPGVCSPPLELGEGCAEGAQCGSNACHWGVCVEWGKAGELCGGEEPGCARGLLCDSGGSGRCIPPPEGRPGELGAVCRSGGSLPCAYNLYCDTEAELCVERAQRGESCRRIGCARGLHCDSLDAVCIPSTPLGEECSVDGPPCAEGRCLASRCRFEKVNGATCDIDDVCRSRYCNPDTGTCDAAPACYRL